MAGQGSGLSRAGLDTTLWLTAWKDGGQTAP